MTRQELEALKALYDEAYPGDWRVVPDPGASCSECEESVESGDWMISREGVPVGIACVLRDDKDKQSADLIVKSHNELPSLISQATLAIDLEEKYASLQKKYDDLLREYRLDHQYDFDGA